MALSGKIFLCMLAASGLLALSVPSQAVRTDVVDENYLTGYLYWANGKGEISWDGPSASEDDVDPGNHAVGLRDEFVSSPVPRTLYLNVSRVVQSDLFFKGTANVLVDVELYAGESFLTGGIRQNTEISYCSDGAQSYLGCADPSQKPAAAGYSAVSHRMQAELDTIPKGSIIKLLVVHQDAAPAQYGLAEDHHSVVRLPLFSADEALYRVPKYAYENQPPSPSPLPALDPVTELVHDVLTFVGAAGLALAVANVAGHSRERPRVSLLLALVFACSMFAGCSSRGTPDPAGGSLNQPLGGSATAFIIPDSKNESGLSNSTRGSLYGVVADPDGLPVNGAYVGVLGTSQFTRTDKYGRFHFNDLTPGSYRLRIDRTGFLSFETTVTVEAASITRVDVTLQFVTVKHVDFRPHRHDYWGGKNSVVLFEQPGIGIGAALSPPFITILPGTTDIELNVTWTGGGTAFAYAVRPDDPNITVLYPRASGVPYHLRTTWEMTDPGHSQYTYWGLPRLWNYPVPPCSKNLYVVSVPNPTCPDPNYQTKLVIHKGVVPLEPAHPDRWGANLALPVIQGEKTTLKDYCVLGSASEDVGIPSPVSGCPMGPLYYGDGLTTKAYNASWAPKGFVPYETQWLEVNLTADRALVGSSSQTPWALFFKGAQRSRYSSQDASRPVEAPKLGSAPLSWTWQVPLVAGEADPPYAPYGSWYFFVAPTNQDDQVVDDYANQGRLPSLTLNAVAHREPLPKP